MLKLISLEGFLSLSSASVRKIENALRPVGLDEAEKFDDIDDFFDAVIEGIDAGDTLVIAAENEEYISVKKQLIKTFSLRSGQSEEVRDAVFESRNGFASVHNLEGHCLAPLDGDLYITRDGLYCGFCIEFSNGARMIYLPLDEERLDDIIPYVKNEINPDFNIPVVDEGDDEDEEDESGVFADILKEEEEKEEEEEPSEEADLPSSPEEEETELSQPEEETSDDAQDEEPAEETPEDVPDEEEAEGETSDAEAPEEVFSGAEAGDSHPEEQIVPVIIPDAPQEEPEKPEKPEDTEEPATLTLKSGEELIIDDSADEADLTGFEEAMAAGAKTAFSLINSDKTVAFVSGETSPFLLAMSNEVDGLSETFKVCEVELEGEDELEIQVALAKKTRLAIKDTGAQFGAAVSPVCKGEKDGKDIYYSYIIIHDGNSAKAKKVSTATQQGVESLIPHAFSVMFGLIERNTESIAQLENEELADESTDRKKKTALLAVCIVMAILAIASAVLMVWKYFQGTEEMFTTTAPSESSTSQPVSGESTSAPTVLPSSNPGIMTTDPLYPNPAEPPASDVSNIPTSTPFSSTKGTFSFTVYGYGHGVGMSQTGADYYAGMGKNYLEILAMYYYGANLVLGDSYPPMVTFGGSSFTMRDYLATAVESEMGGSYNPEALKAQVVAIYTFAKYYNFDVPNTLHAFDKTPTQPSYDAVDTVIGQYMTYNGEVIKPYFHATSAGKTASYTNVFGDDQIPYLSGGRPSYGDVNAKNYCTTVTYTSDELNALVYSKTGKQLSGDPANWLKILSHDACINENTGYISKIQVGEDVYSGYDFRMKVLGGALRSHCFTFIYTPTS